MKNVMGVVVAFLMVASNAFAAVQYEYFQTIRSDVQDMPASNLNARAVLDGQRTRVDFISGNTYPPGTYVISNDASKRLLFVDPTQKSYTEVNTLGIASAIATSGITITNLQADVAKLSDSQVIAGIPADHYRLTITYDITVAFRTLPLKQSVRTIIDKWTTVRYGDVGDASLAGTVQTGNQKVDELITDETQKIRGFPLKQTVQIVTINQSGAAAESKLRLPASRTMTREMTVTSIADVRTDDALFRIPADYRKVDFNDQITKSQTQVLSTTPAQ